jgi:hypothetical protein
MNLFLDRSAHEMKPKVGAQIACFYGSEVHSSPIPIKVSILTCLIPIRLKEISLPLHISQGHSLLANLNVSYGVLEAKFK